MLFELEDMQSQDAVIKVIGVGGCGGNAVDHMINRGMTGVEFITINTDAQALRRNKASVQLQIGNSAPRPLAPAANGKSAVKQRWKIASGSPS